MTAEGTPIDREKLLSLSYLSRGRTRNHVREGRDDFGTRFKATTDELGNTVTQRGEDRQDVTIRAPKLAVTATAKEEPHQ